MIRFFIAVIFFVALMLFKLYADISYFLVKLRKKEYDYDDGNGK